MKHLTATDIAELAKHAAAARLPKAAHCGAGQHPLLPPQRAQRRQRLLRLPRRRRPHHVANVCHGRLAATLGVVPRTVLHRGRGKDRGREWGHDAHVETGRDLRAGHRSRRSR